MAHLIGVCVKRVAICFLLSGLVAQQITRLRSRATTHLVSFLKNYVPEDAVIVEAGSFNGSDSVKFVQTWLYAKVHAFEPVPEIFELLVKRAKKLPQITCYQYALSTTTGSACFITSEEPRKPNIPSMAGSLRAPKEHLKYSRTLFKKSIMVDTITLDEWAQKNNITTIDLLWLDTQGTELDIIKASPNILKNIGCICLEVEFVEAYEGQALYAEIKDFLEQHGFELVARNFDEQPHHWFGDAIFVRKQHFEDSGECL